MNANLFGVVTGLLGVIGGAVLRPLVDEFFARRRRSLMVKLLAADPIAVPLGHSVGSLTWDGHPVAKIITLPFKIKNISGRRLSAFAIEISLERVDEAPAEKPIMSVSFDPGQGARLEAVTTEDPSRVLLKFDYFQPRAELTCGIVANHQGKPVFIPDGDLIIHESVMSDLERNRPYVYKWLGWFSVLYFFVLVAWFIYSVFALGIFDG